MRAPVICSADRGGPAKAGSPRWLVTRLAPCALLPLLLGCAPTRPLTPAWEEIRKARFSGIEEAGGTVQLEDGRWNGPPWVEGGAAAPSVLLVDHFRLDGELDDRPGPETVVLLAASSGGSGERLHAAVVGRKGDRLENLATPLLGDRVQVRSGRLTEGRLQIDLVAAGEQDPACCPGDLVSREWTWQAGQLREEAPRTTGRLSPAVLTGSSWVLRAWDRDEPAPTEGTITLQFSGNGVSGQAGCNRFRGPLKAGDSPDEMHFGPLATTRRLCPPDEMEAERRFLQRLSEVQTFRFQGGHLLLVGRGGESRPAALRFEPAPPDRAGTAIPEADEPR